MADFLADLPALERKADAASDRKLAAHQAAQDAGDRLAETCSQIAADIMRDGRALAHWIASRDVILSECDVFNPRTLRHETIEQALLAIVSLGYEPHHEAHYIAGRVRELTLQLEQLIEQHPHTLKRAKEQIGLEDAAEAPEDWS